MRDGEFYGNDIAIYILRVILLSMKKASHCNAFLYGVC